MDRLKSHFKTSQICKIDTPINEPHSVELLIDGRRHIAVRRTVAPDGCIRFDPSEISKIEFPVQPPVQSSTSQPTPFGIELPTWVFFPPVDGFWKLADYHWMVYLDTVTDRDIQRTLRLWGFEMMMGQAALIPSGSNTVRILPATVEYSDLPDGLKENFSKHLGDLGGFLEHHIRSTFQRVDGVIRAKSLSAHPVGRSFIFREAPSIKCASVETYTVGDYSIEVGRTIDGKMVAFQGGARACVPTSVAMVLDHYRDRFTEEQEVKWVEYLIQAQDTSLSTEEEESRTLERRELGKIVQVPAIDRDEALTRGPLLVSASTSIGGHAFVLDMVDNNGNYMVREPFHGRAQLVSKEIWERDAKVRGEPTYYRFEPAVSSSGAPTTV